MNLYGFVANSGVEKIDKLGQAVFVVTAFSAKDKLLREDATQLRATEEERKHVLDFAAEVGKIYKTKFRRLVSDGKVKFNGAVYTGTQEDYVKLVKREAEVSLLQNVPQGGLNAARNKMVEIGNLGTENHDVFAFLAHGGYTVINLEERIWEATGTIALSGDIVSKNDVAKMINSMNKKWIWVSCFNNNSRKGESGWVVAAKGKVSYGYSSYKRPDGKTHKFPCDVRFKPFGFKPEIDKEDFVPEEFE